MVQRQQPLDFFFQFLRMCRELFEEAARGWFARSQMKCFENEPRAPLWRSQPYQCGNHRAIAMSPKDRALNPYRIQHQKSLLGCPLMEIRRHLSGQLLRTPVAGSIWDYEAHTISECLDLTIDRIDPITPTSVQENYWPPTAHIPVMNLYRPDSGGMRRLWQLHKRQAISIPRTN